MAGWMRRQPYRLGGLTHPPPFPTNKNKIKKNTIYEEKGEKSQTEKKKKKTWERRCVEVQQDGKEKNERK